MNAQDNPPTQPSKNIQPKIIVIPRVADGQDMKAFYDANTNIQIAIAKINEAFQKRGANLRTFDQVLKQLKENEQMNSVSGNQTDFKTKVLAGSSADIYVEIKLDVVNHPERKAKSVNIILEAYQAGTGNSIASKTAAGPMFQTEDVGLLTMKAIDLEAEGFLNLMQLKFDDIRENGQSAYIEFSINSGSQFTFDSEVKGKLLSSAIDDWFEKNSVKGVYNNQGVVENKLIISDVRIPLKKRTNPNANYTGETLFSEIFSYLKTLGVDSKRIIGTNNKILITIL